VLTRASAASVARSGARTVARVVRSRRHQGGARDAPATPARRHIARASVVMLAAHASSFTRGDATIVPQSSVASRRRVNRVCEAKESRIGKHPVAVPKGVTYTLKDNFLSVKVRTRVNGRTGRRWMEGDFDCIAYARRWETCARDASVGGDDGSRSRA